MKTYTRYEDLPAQARYLGSENGDGTMYETLADHINMALYPVRLREPDGTYSYFELAP